jgi:hypothetical protein
VRKENEREDAMARANVQLADEALASDEPLVSGDAPKQANRHQLL